MNHSLNSFKRHEPHQTNVNNCKNITEPHHFSHLGRAIILHRQNGLLDLQKEQVLRDLLHQFLLHVFGKVLGVEHEHARLLDDVLVDDLLLLLQPADVAASVFVLQTKIPLLTQTEGTTHQLNQFRARRDQLQIELELRIEAANPHGKTFDLFLPKRNLKGNRNERVVAGRLVALTILRSIVLREKMFVDLCGHGREEKVEICENKYFGLLNNNKG
jgi:hypothetical protein